MKLKWRWKKVLSTIGIVLLVLILLTTGVAAYTVRQSWPQESGSIKIPGLKDKVEVLRDKWGVPHIYASNQHDLFMAQGYVHAQDRFWQMDFWRHLGAGRLAEMFGKAQLETDQFLRTLGWARVAQQELEQAQPELKAMLQAYADGVNAHLGDREGNALSLEYAVLKLLNPNYKPEPWQPLNSLTWGKAMAWDLGGNMGSEIQRAILLKTLKPEQVNELYPPYPAEQPLILPDFKLNGEFRTQNPELRIGKSTVLNSCNTSTNPIDKNPEFCFNNSPVLSSLLSSTESPPSQNLQPSKSTPAHLFGGGLGDATVPQRGFGGRPPKSGFLENESPSTQKQENTYAEILQAIAPALESISAPVTALEDVFGPTGSGIGSNNWVISGKRTATGKPILANDPHLGEQMPSIWYEIGLHCTAKTSDCPYDVTGFSFAGMLGVIIGHNDKIAWGVTNVGPDVMDLYIEKINPKNPYQYEVNGKWVDMQLVEEKIQVAGGKSITQKVRYTRHGPIISDTYANLQQFNQKAGINLPKHYAIALRWTALEPSSLANAITKIDRAQNWQEFRTALQDFDIPSQNFVYADLEGNIGYQMPGEIPIRKNGDGRYPVPGWTDEFEWLGYIPFEKLPSTFNPPQGYIATANNPVVGADYPYLITNDFDYGFRAERITEMIEKHTQPITTTDVQKMHGDNKNLNAQTLVPILQQIPLNNKHLETVRNLLQNWDFQQNMDGSAAVLFETFWKHLLAETFHDELPKQYWPIGGNQWFAVIKNLVKQPNNSWWDNKKTRTKENRDRIFTQAFTKAVDEIERKLGKDTSRWNWGQLHTTTFRNPTLGKSGVAPIEAMFNRGPFPTSGGSEIVNATAWNATKSFAVTWLPSMRMIVDLANLDNSLSINTTGQSGHAYHKHYDDMVDLWRKIEYHPMLSSKDQIAKGSVTLTLTP